MRTVRFELLRPGEIVAERDRCPVAYVPLGPLEWHSLHNPMGTDALNAQEVARQLAEQVGGVVLPTFFWGTERERSPEVAHYLGFNDEQYVVGMDHPNHVLPSVYCREEFFALMVRELFDALIRLDYRLIVVVNGHGALNHVATLERLCREFTALSPARAILLHAKVDEPVMGHEMSHACVVETSLMMHLHPESVDLGQLPPAPEPLPYQRYGIVDTEAWAGNPTPDHTLRPASDPRLHASAAYGKVYIESVVSELAERVRMALNDECSA